MTRLPVAMIPFRKPRRLTFSMTAWTGVMSGSCGGRLDGGGDALVAATAADVAAHDTVYLFFGGVFIRCEQRGGLHDLAGLTIAALRDIQGAPCLLHRMIAVGIESLDRYHGPTGNILYRGYAGAGSLAVDVDGTGAAQGYAAPVFCSGKSELVPQIPEQWHRWIAIIGLLLAVDAQLDHAHFLPYDADGGDSISQAAARQYA